MTSTPELGPEIELSLDPLALKKQQELLLMFFMS
jgi:hypothetical protein